VQSFGFADVTENNHKMEIMHTKAVTQQDTRVLMVAYNCNFFYHLGSFSMSGK
jgi:hypothetical protein